MVTFYWFADLLPLLLLDSSISSVFLILIMLILLFWNTARYFVPIFCSSTHVQMHPVLPHLNHMASPPRNLFSTTHISFLRIRLTPYLCLCVAMILCFIITVCVFSFLPDNELLWGGKMFIHKFQYLWIKWKKIYDIGKYYRWRQLSRDNSQWHAITVPISLSMKPFLY